MKAKLLLCLLMLVVAAQAATIEDLIAPPAALMQDCLREQDITSDETFTVEGGTHTEAAHPQA